MIVSLSEFVICVYQGFPIREGFRVILHETVVPAHQVPPH